MPRLRFRVPGPAISLIRTSLHVNYADIFSSDTKQVVDKVLDLESLGSVD